MSGAHTPGPWFAGQSENQRAYGQWSVGLSLDNEGSASGYRQVGDLPWDRDGYLNVGGVCREADARLMAAAPDLLAALEAAEDALAEHCPGLTYLLDDMISPAIAKARGAA